MLPASYWFTFLYEMELISLTTPQKYPLTFLFDVLKSWLSLKTVLYGGAMFSNYANLPLSKLQSYEICPWWSNLFLFCTVRNFLQWTKTVVFKYHMFWRAMKQYTANVWPANITGITRAILYPHSLPVFSNAKSSTLVFPTVFAGFDINILFQ